VLDLERLNGIYDPVEAKNGIDTHCSVVDPNLLISKHLAEKRVLGVRLAERPVHDDVPEAAIQGIYNGEQDEDSAISACLVDAVNAESDVEHDGSHIFCAIKEMRECGSGIGVAAKTLKGAPYCWEGGEEAEETGVIGVALYWV
jgi:hypothetical protein